MKVKELLSDPSKWTQGANARDSRGIRVPSADPEATCFCIVGALLKCYGTTSTSKYLKIAAKIQHNDVVSWNDAPERTHAEVLELVTRLDT
jgi:hypothetical protein